MLHARHVIKIINSDDVLERILMNSSLINFLMFADCRDIFSNKFPEVIHEFI